MNSEFQWKEEPEAEQFILNFVEKAIQLNERIDALSKELYSKTSTRLFDWIDYIEIPESASSIKAAESAGFVKAVGFYFHPGAQLPRLVFKNHSETNAVLLAISVDSISDFLMTHGGSTAEIEGSFYGNFRRASYSTLNGACLTLVERRGTDQITPSHESSEMILNYFLALEKWMKRPRPFEDQNLEETIHLVNEIIGKIGKERAAWTILEGERLYWQSKNRAGQIQKARQDRLGMGWANHDHHTFRSSRKNFKALVHLFELLGFHCRERFYAGLQAGWGAQVMENPTCKLVLFLDVDLSPEELMNDFAHDPLPELKDLGTIGLWCALHGDSILKGGMHHLEAQFMFDELKGDLSQEGIEMMNPFSDFSYLKQAFTKGEVWPVALERVQALKKEGKITDQQADAFVKNGAIGSHLENLQRRAGFKGFNSKSVSEIIKKTDPRLQNFSIDAD